MKNLLKTLVLCSSFLIWGASGCGGDISSDYSSSGGTQQNTGTNSGSNRGGSGFDNNNGTGGNGGNGTGGSLSGFKVIGNFLYAIDKNMVYTFDVTDPNAPKKVGNGQFVLGVETLFAYKEFLLIGSNVGMYITKPNADGTLGVISAYQHITTCDPVVAADNIAYVTLRSGRSCGTNTRNINVLDVLDISDVKSPRLLRSYQMSFPEGLGVDGKNLFICDDQLKRFDATDPNNLQLVETLDLKALDVIPLGGTLLALSDNKISQIDYTGNMKVVSEITLKK